MFTNPHRSNPQRGLIMSRDVKSRAMLGFEPQTLGLRVTLGIHYATDAR